MLGDYFYHATTRKLISVFGTLFNDIEIQKKDTNGKVLNTIRVPLAYGPKEKFLARLDQQSDISENQIAIKLPRLSFEITGFSYDSNTKQNKYNRIAHTNTAGTNRANIRTYAPYRLNIDLNILANKSDDALQILEQIVPYFQPDYNVTIKSLGDLDNVKDDVSITLQSVSPAEEYEGDFLSRKAVLYTLGFELKARYYGPVTNTAQIKTAIVNFNDTDSLETMKTLTHTVIPVQAEASAVINSSVIESINITEEGAGYTSVPNVTITGDGVGATAVATLDDSQVISIEVTDGGSGYSTATVTIDAPPSNVDDTIFVYHDYLNDDE